MTVDVRAALPAEAAVVAKLHELCLGEAWQADSVGRLMALPGAFALFAVPAERPAAEPVGFILCVPSPPALDIAAMGVVPPRRRSGVGARLLDAAMARARDGGAAALLLEVADDNSAALSLYRGRGFVRAGVRRGYYRRVDGNRDAVVLRRSLLIGTSSGE